MILLYFAQTHLPLYRLGFPIAGHLVLRELGFTSTKIKPRENNQLVKHVMWFCKMHFTQKYFKNKRENMFKKRLSSNFSSALREYISA